MSFLAAMSRLDCRSHRTGEECRVPDEKCCTKDNKYCLRSEECKYAKRERSATVQGKHFDSLARQGRHRIPIRPKRDVEGWQVKLLPRVQMQQKRSDANAHDMLQAGTRSDRANVTDDRDFHMYVGGLHEDNSADVISTWLKGCGINSVTDNKVSPDLKPYSSFHIVLRKRDYFKIIKHKCEYWPDNAICRRFFPSKKEDEEDTPNDDASTITHDDPDVITNDGRTQAGDADQAVGGVSRDTRGVAGGDEEKAGTGQVSENTHISDRYNDTSHHIENENDANESEVQTGNGEDSTTT